MILKKLLDYGPLPVLLNPLITRKIVPFVDIVGC